MEELGDLARHDCHFKQKYLECQQELQKYKQDMLEYQESSHELEVELEAQLDQCEQRNKELEYRTHRVEADNQKLYQRLQLTELEVTDLQREVETKTVTNGQLTACLTELEQQNDDMERAERNLGSSLEDFEARLNFEIEKNVYLEMELSEKEELKGIVQRLKDEARDLRNELNVVQQQTLSGALRRSSIASAVSEGSGSGKTRSNTVSSLSTVNTKRGSFAFGPNNSTTNASESLDPSSSHSPRNMSKLSISARLSALKIVTDLLKKVTKLETKLASC